jgi:hypothetical protein
MQNEPSAPASARERLAQYPLLDALRGRRSRRFGLGMAIPGGPLAYRSRFRPAPLSEEQEAALAFAACGVTGYALADLCYAGDQGGNIMAGLAGRTIASGDGLQTVALVVINDQATYLLKRPRDFAAPELRELIELSMAGAFTELYRRSRLEMKRGRVAPPLEPLFNLNVNKWSLHAPGSSYFLPVNDLTWMYVNGLLEIFNEHTGAFVLDERAGFAPAGVARFARSKGGHLEDDPRKGRVATIQLVERLVTEFVTVEQGMMLQNLGLMTQALGLGGFPHFANHEFAWFQALGFRMGEMPASRYLGVDPLRSLGMKLLGRDTTVPYPLGWERDGQPVLKPCCPPYYPSMEAAVRAVVASKFGPGGVFRPTADVGPWKNSGAVTKEVPPVSEASIAATIAYCDYVWRRYGRFPAYLTPWRTVLAYQACHLDAEFYERFYKSEALTESQRADFARVAGG